MNYQSGPTLSDRHATLTALIFDELFPAKIRQIDLVGDIELKMFGFPTTLDKAVDNSMKNSLTDIMISINGMVTHFEKGVVVRVSDIVAKQIYDIINPYLHCWLDVITYGMNVSNAPLDDLKLLDKFAAKVYPYASAFITDEYIHSAIVQRSKSNGFGFGRLFAEPVVPEEEKETPVREGLADALIEGMTRFGNRRLG